MKLILCILTLLVFCGCDKTEYGPLKHEQATVVQTIYSPATHGTVSGTNLDLDGNLSFSNSTIETQESWAVVFACEHGQFVIHKKEIWEKVKPNQQVTISYKEVYRVSSDGKAALVKYDFIGVADR